MDKATLIYLAKIIFRPKDQLSKLTLGLLSLGMTGLVGGWTFNIVFSKTFIKRYNDVIDGVSLNYQRYSDIAMLVSLFLLLSALFYGVFAYT
ncbi:hypothetical protein [Pantoea rwandensis]|uniref:hypothetical protein n=1 Tax=Pantoea rwandensis TaxID=1076550 RepID=UPI001FE43F27|nr:hypothetical protein [Pantoea rwandensis]